MGAESAVPKGGGRGCITVFLTVFLLAGLGMILAMVRAAFESLLVYGWERAECTIVHSAGRIVEANEYESPYEFEVSYRYRYNGRDYASESIGSAQTPSAEAGRTVIRTGNWESIEERLERYKPGSRVGCFVNKRDPAQAALERAAPWLRLVLPLPLLFVLLGGGGIYLLWRVRRHAKPKALSQKGVKGQLWHPWGKGIVFGLLTLIGGGVTWGFVYQPARRAISAPGWKETPCRILFSRVGRHSGDDGDTYSVDVLYEYTFNGRTRRSSRYELITVSSSGIEGKSRAVEKYAPGTTTVCYVNPSRPAEAVLNRDFPWLLLLGLVPLGMFCGGVAGFVSMARGARPAAAEPERTGDTLRLRPSITRPGRALGCGLFTLLWNGLTGVFVVVLAREWMAGEAPWGASLIVSPFVLVGVGGIWGTIYYTLALFAPTVELALTPGRLWLGGGGQLEWSLKKGLGRLRKLTILLVAREEATYARGTNSVTDKEEFHRTVVAETGDAYDLERGTRSVSIPARTMHSFTSAHNRVTWLVKVEGKVTGGPDIDEEYPIEVGPQNPWRRP
jgi:hypothetical protein